MEQAARLNFSASNNKAKYEPILVELDLALALVATKLETRSDSQLIFGQIQREYEAKDERMARYLTIVESHLEKLDELVIRWVPHDESKKIDALAGIVATFPIKEAVMMPVYLKVTLSITPEPAYSTSEANFDWMHDIMRYL